MLRLLGVTAHPDDEAGAFGGTLATYADRGVETAVICLTPGQAASHRGAANDDQHLAQLRREEFAASCRLLRVTRGEVLDYRDGSLVLESFHRMVGDVVRRIREFRPHVVLALGTEGLITAHPDHTMASLVGTCAFHWAAHATQYTDQIYQGLQPHRAQKLYFTSATFHLPEREPTSLAPITSTIEIGEHLETKIAAFKCHTTQGPLFALLENNMRKRGAVEVFHLAACIEIGPAREETDLFEGVTDTGD
ncbi:MAG: PIG-L deacetylase family protein [Terriglobales bacterium]